MKIKLFKRQALGTAMAVLCLMGAPSLIKTPAEPATDVIPVTPDRIETSGELPPFIFPTSPLAQVVHLSQAGVDQTIIMTFIANSGSTFNLDSDKIIYLKDIGLPNEVVTAMIERDQQLQLQIATASQPTPPPEPPEPPAPAPETEPAPPPAEVTINTFHETLAPYGSWITVDGYGRCWRPSVVAYNPGWQPYCDHGHWVYTDSGWYWYSDYSWGWAPFHYGRWFQHSRWGWCWTPDTVWGPSWVTWRYSNDYCGWAPLPPFAVFRPGVGFFYRGAAVSVGFNWDLGVGCFAFVPTRYFCDPHPRQHCLPHTRMTQVFNQTAVINNFHVRDHDHGFVNHGIDPEHITAVTHNPIHPIPIRNAPTTPGHGPRGDHLSPDGNTLFVSHPPRRGSPASGRPPQQNNHRTGMPSQPVSPPQAGSAVRVPPQHPTAPAGYNSSPTPHQNNRSPSPRQQQQSPRPSPGSAYGSGAGTFGPSSHAGQPGAAGAGHHSGSGAAAIQPPAPPAQSPSSPPAPPAPRSSGASQNQNHSNGNSGGASGNNSSGNSGGNSGSSSGGGSFGVRGSGPGH
jgi:uncharacterized membrane protein YgcG